MGSKSTLAGMEVPIIGMDTIKWIELSVAITNTAATSTCVTTRLSDDCASCSIIGDPPIYFIWRIYKARPHMLELIELSAHKDFSGIGLRIIFPDALFPFAYISQNKIDSFLSSLNNPYLLYAMTVSGTAYSFRLRNISAYSSCSNFPRDELLEFNLQNYFHNGPITSVAATAGYLIVGRNDGSVVTFRLGLLHHDAPGFVHELRDDSGISRLWSFMSRGRTAGALQDMVVLNIHGIELLFVLHSDGTLQVWDLLRSSKILSDSTSIPDSEGVTSVRLWVGEPNNDSSVIPLAVLCSRSLEISKKVIYVFSLHCTLDDRIIFSLGASVQNIPLEEGKCIDVKLTSKKIWILRDNGLMMHNIFHKNMDEKESQFFTLQEELVAEHLFQSSEQFSLEDLVSMSHSVFSSAKDHVGPFISNIFLRRLLCPGVHHNAVLRSTLLDYNRHWTDSEFRSLTVDGLKKEIRSIIEHQGVSESATSICYHWRNFCARYFHYWCKDNGPCGLIVQSSVGVVGLVRKNSVSLFRDLEDIEPLVDGSADGLFDLVSSGLDLLDDGYEQEILLEVLRCIICMSQQLGKTASAMFYETLVSTPSISSDEIIPRLLKLLETGYSSSVSMYQMSDVGGDVALVKELVGHKNLRKFSIEMLLSLDALSKKAASWGKVLNVIESYLQILVPQKIIQKIDADVTFNIHTSVMLQAASQITKVMFESAFDVLLFVNYLLNLSGQIDMLHDDVSRIQLELVPMIQETVSEWLIIHFLVTTPSESPAIEDFSSQLSTLQLDSNTDKRSWNEKLGKCDSTLAFILLLTSQTSSGIPSHSLLCLPTPPEIISSVRDFISWIIWGKTGEDSTFLRRSNELAMILLRNGQYNAVEYLLTTVEANSLREKISRSIQETDDNWCVLQHLLGCCLLAQARYGFHGVLKERKVHEAVRCFFRASSRQRASQALQDFSHIAGLPQLGFDGCASHAAWKLHYYQWVMQVFEQYNSSEGACQFALAALEHVEEALRQGDDFSSNDNESATNIKGRMWANVFKFSLDLNLLYDAYCAVLSNPDEESKHICLRRFIIVLYECGAMKVLCDGRLPFVGLAEKIEQELAWKAERSDVLAKPNAYKLLYALEMHRHNWRRAASYIYQYSARLRTEAILKDSQHVSLMLHERLSGLSAAINALHLVHPAYAWIEHLGEASSFPSDSYQSKKAKKTVKDQLAGNEIQAQRLQFYIDIEKLQNEFVLTSAEYWLSLSNVKWTFSGKDKVPSDVIDLLVQTNSYEMAFTVILQFWKGSGLKRELERVFSAMSLKCCPNKLGSTSTGTNVIMLTSSRDAMVVRGSSDVVPASQLSSQWETLEHYLVSIFCTSFLIQSSQRVFCCFQFNETSWNRRIIQCLI
uniref:Nuclear pore complex protein NUP160 isoform X3 n=1 Tax=Rhizophora mucronata TaxID=61149 RepID=A0A2P2MJN9_RHIMU